MTDLYLENFLLDKVKEQGIFKIFYYLKNKWKKLTSYKEFKIM